MAELSVQQMLSIARQVLSGRDLKIYELHFHDRMEAGERKLPMTLYGVAKRLEISERTVNRAIQAFRPKLDEAFDEYRQVELKVLGFVPDAYRREDYKRTLGYGHKAKGVEDLTVKQSIGPEINRIRKAVRLRVDAKVREIEDRAA